MKVYRQIVEQLSQLFPNNWDNCSTLADGVEESSQNNISVRLIEV